MSNEREYIRKFGKKAHECNSGDICNECGEPYGQHFGFRCPDPKPERKVIKGIIKETPAPPVMPKRDGKSFRLIRIEK